MTFRQGPRSNPAGACVSKVLINIGEIPGWPSWTRIEPCAWYHRRISGSCLRKSGRYPSRPGAETPARWRKRLVCMRPGRANRAFNQYRSLAPNAPPFLGGLAVLTGCLPEIECRGSKETIGSPLATVNAMSATFRVPTMTRDQFLNWAEAQGGRHEFDGFQPVAMTGGNLNHNQIAINILVALRGRLGGTGCRPHGMDAGVATIGDTVRYPDGVVTCSRRTALAVVPDPVWFSRSSVRLLATWTGL